MLLECTAAEFMWVSARNEIGQDGCVTQTEVQALAGDRMQRLGRVSDEYRARLDDASMPEPERK